MKLNIVTPLSRGENLLALYENVRSHYDKGVDFTWWVILDPKADINGEQLFALVLDPKVNVIGNYDGEGVAGHNHRNLVINVLQEEDKGDEWFMSLDDDNLLHPNLFDKLKNLKIDENLCGILFDQANKDGSKRLEVKHNDIGLNRTDTAQFILKVKCIGDMRFDETRYDADGVFIYEFYEKYKLDCLLINEDLCYYNFLR